MKGPVARGACMRHLHALKHSWQGVGKKIQDCVLNSQGFIVQSHKIPLHVTNKWMRQAKGKERVGWKMSAATVKLLLISHARAWRSSPPRRVTSEEQGWQRWGSFCSAAQLTLNFLLSTEIHFIFHHAGCAKIKLSVTCVLCKPESRVFCPNCQYKRFILWEEACKAFRLSSCGLSETTMSF